MHCLYFICEREFYERTHVKITRHWNNPYSGLRSPGWSRSNYAVICLAYPPDIVQWYLSWTLHLSMYLPGFHCVPKLFVQMSRLYRTPANSPYWHHSCGTEKQRNVSQSRLATLGAHGHQVAGVTMLLHRYSNLQQNYSGVNDAISGRVNSEVKYSRSSHNWPL